MLTQAKIPILVLGGTGQLGCLIIKELLNHPEFIVSVLTRDSLKCENTRLRIEISGGRIITGDVTNPNSIANVTKGIHTVISALDGDESVLLQGQTNILNDGLNNDLKRFVPSDFTFDIWNLSLGTNYCVDQVLKFRQILDKEKERVKGLYFTTGFFMETYFSLVEKDGFLYWNDLNRKIDLISMLDVAKFVVAAVKDPNWCGDVMVSAIQCSIKQICETYNQITGKNLQLKNMGNINDLKELIKKYKQEGNSCEALRYGYYYLAFGENTLIPNRMNEKFPDVKATSLEEFLEKNKGKLSYELPLLDIAKNVPKEKLLQFAI